MAEYFDSRGVRRTYGVSLDDGVLRFWREKPGFDQRFSAVLETDSFVGLWQLAETPGDWRDDLRGDLPAGHGDGRRPTSAMKASAFQ